MSSNVGLSTPRGSGTSGYVQRSLSHLKPRDAAAPYTKDHDLLRHRQRQPDKDILEHDRKREVEVKVFELRDKLEEEECAPPAQSQCEPRKANLRPELMKTKSRTSAPPYARNSRPSNRATTLLQTQEVSSHIKSTS